jgi:hypothetical protein
MRRLVIAGGVAGVLAVGGAAFAGTAPAPVRATTSTTTHEICLATSNDPAHARTQDLCITFPGAVGPR